MEFANGQVAGSIYSIGYLVTNEDFEILTPATDLCINPDCKWNDYVVQNILAYPKDEIEAAPAFPLHYDFLKELFSSVDVAVGFAVGNDVKALQSACRRYELPQISYRWFDAERLCRKTDQHREARGLGGCVRAWCGKEPQNRHRSDGDALATMNLLKAVCEAMHVSADMLLEAYPDCAGKSTATPKAKPKSTSHKRRKRAPHKKKSTEKENSNEVSDRS